MPCEPPVIATESVGQTSWLFRWLFREPDATPEIRIVHCCRNLCCMSHMPQRHTRPTGSVTGYGYGYSQRRNIDELGRMRGDALRRHAEPHPRHNDKHTHDNDSQI
jgi:hypothetical protein